MSDFPDVEKFAAQHVDCGGIAPSAAPRAAGGYLLTLTCACGAIHKRVITLEEARKPLPLPRTRPTPTPSARPPAPPDRRAGPSDDVAAALREALEAEEAAAAAAEDATAAAPPAAPPAAAPAAGPAKPAGRATPGRLDLDATIRSALDRQKQQADKIAESEAQPRPSRARAVVLVLVVFLLMGALSFVLLGGLADEPTETVVGAPSGPQIDSERRAALQAVVASLRQVQASTPPDASYPVYSSRVLVAKSDVERYVQRGESAPARSIVREMMDLHLLANAALRAKALDSKDALEAIGRDPALAYCADVRPLLDAVVAAEGQSVEQVRGAVLVGAVPQLFECARQRLADLERLAGPR